MDQLADLQEHYAELREVQRREALRLREEGRTQPQVEQLVGVPQQTISRWEREAADTSNTHASKTNKPDIRVTVPKSTRQEIYDRVQAGETQKAVADAYGVTQGRVSQIVNKIEADLNPEPTPALPDGVYDVIYADPPWQYDFSQAGRGTHTTRNCAARRCRARNRFKVGEQRY